ncbi:retropepsin-like aspartic protease [Chitinophaga sancti]|uniref:Aspartyl protease family protein n=1 Tax=Chitinophaga sancti TaxID=1004 RepID=A0A1K1SGX4_9BACT|nr:retropepsin-like aspartic protease [Chitinophaga sancti]WQD59864.1 retropepsin-like aspartic protease [Chitinophaga sancti]WQG88005.1 retropepsin-like aspartic protease [Chitinophaga sancti]SFW83327.1 aspartyl protease family protein [Chitinophaga sancti]
MKQLFVMLGIVLFLSGCSGCSQSGRRKSHNRTAADSVVTPPPTTVEGGRTVVKMEKVNGVFQVPVEVNDVRMHFIFDTGASIISISETEAMFLYKQGSLSKDDILGSANFTDANGNISAGTVVNLRTVKIGDRILRNVQASVVHNLDAPLLLGQSALGGFMKISIDYKRGEIIFE